MIEKIVMNGDDARTKLMKGVSTIAGAVKITLGPKGRNVIVDRIRREPIVTNDGVTIAKEIVLSDEIEDAGAQVLKTACIKTNDIAGDGTTTAIVLAEKIFSEGMKYLQTGANPILLRNGIKKAVSKVVEYIQSKAIPIREQKAIIQIATISSENEEDGKLVAQAFEKVGLDGVITIEEGNNMETTLSVTEGMRINRGFISPYMCQDTNKQIASLHDAYIFITDKKISNINEILPVIDKVSNVGGSLFIIAEDIEGDALTTLVINNMRRTFNCLAIKTPYFGDRRKKVLEDIALSVGAKFFSADVFSSFKDVSLDDLGRADTINSDKDSTTIIGGKGNKEKVKERVENLKNQIVDAETDFDKTVLTQRIAQLNGGVAVIKVGAISEVEMREKKLRMEDALNATHAAIEEGIVLGGGVAYLKAKKSLDTYIEELSGDEKLGAMIVSKSLESPIRQIAKNAGIDDGVIVQNILNHNDENFGYDALKNNYCDMIISGIIDPLKVTRTAIECASSVASTLLTTECVVVQNKEKLIDEHTGERL